MIMIIKIQQDQWNKNISLNRFIVHSIGNCVPIKKIHFILIDI